MRTKIRRKKTAHGIRWYVSSLSEDGREEAHGGYGTQKEATAAAAALVTAAARRTYVSPAKLTLGAYLLDEWLPSRETADLSETTRDTDRTVGRGVGDPLDRRGAAAEALGARTWTGCTGSSGTRGGQGGRPLSGKSARNAHVTLHKALHDAVRRGHLVVNVADAVDPPAREDSVERTAWTRDEVRRFIWRLALATGLRRGELTGLRWDDLDDGAVHVRRQVLVRPEPSGGSAACTCARHSRTGARVAYGSTTGPPPTSAGESGAERGAVRVRRPMEGRRRTRCRGSVDRDGGRRRRRPPRHAARQVAPTRDGGRRSRDPVARRAALLRRARAQLRRPTGRREPNDQPRIRQLHG